jgi:YbgC/YbaW family acyl-CoA thioester hydrolase
MKERQFRHFIESDDLQLLSTSDIKEFPSFPAVKRKTYASTCTAPGKRLKEGIMTEFKFSIPIKIRVGDLNYGNHVGYQNYFLFFQDARIAYLRQFNCSEMDIEGYGMIISEADCRYKRELFLNDDIEVKCRVSSITSMLFRMSYQIERSGELCSTGTTTNLCYDYKEKQRVNLPERFIQSIKKFECIG